MFKNQLDLARIILFGVCLYLLLIGCQPAINQGIETVPATEIVANEQDSPLLNVMTIVTTRSIPNTPTSTWTPIPTMTSSLTPQPTSTPTLTPPATVTPTPWPTLSPDEAISKVMSLLANNQDPECLLPCWWGATPGQTRWQNIVPFLNSLAKEIYFSSSQISFGAEVILPLPESVAAINSSDYRTFYGWNESGIIHGIIVDSINISGYDPETMLTLYGVPDEVWLTTDDDLLGDILPFRLIIVYQEQGISLRYYVNATIIGETVTACFKPGIELERPELFPAGPRIYLWVPGEYKMIEEISTVPRETYFPLESKTNLTPETLYEKFTNSNEQPCIDTPTTLWSN